MGGGDKQRKTESLQLLEMGWMDGWMDGWMTRHRRLGDSETKEREEKRKEEKKRREEEKERAWPLPFAPCAGHGGSVWPYR